MTQVRSIRSVYLGVAAVTLMAVATVTSIAVPSAMRGSPPVPPVIATVDLENAVNGLNERAEAEASMKAYTQGLQEDLTKLGKELENKQNALQVMQGQAKKDAAAELIQLRANAKVKKEVYEALIDQRRGEMLKKLYEKISDAAKRLAQQNKYTMVIVSDENVRVPDGPSQDIERTISMKRYLFVDPAHDITADLITLMNNEFKAGVGGAPVAPGAAAPR